MSNHSHHDQDNWSFDECVQRHEAANEVAEQVRKLREDETWRYRDRLQRDPIKGSVSQVNRIQIEAYRRLGKENKVYPFDVFGLNEPKENTKPQDKNDPLVVGLIVFIVILILFKMV